MNVEQARELMVALGVHAAGQGEGWVRSSCPLAPWLHRGGRDSRPSFGLMIKPGEHGTFHCFACESGSLPLLLQLIEFHNQRSPGLFHGNLTKAREIVENEHLEMPVAPGYQEFPGAEQRTFKAVPEAMLDPWQPAHIIGRAAAYMDRRKITPAESIKWNLRYDPKGDRLVFPYRDVFGRLAGARGRGIELEGEKHPFPHFDYPWQGVHNAGMVWFNERVLADLGPVVVVEGQIDCLRVARVYPRVVANLTAKPTEAKLKKLVYCEGVILMLDGDDTGRLATREWVHKLQALNINVAQILLPMDQGKTDPDKLGEQWIADALHEVGLL